MSGARPSPSDFQVGDRVRFARATDPNMANDDPLYEPAVPAGKTGTVVAVRAEYVRVELDDKAFWPGAVTIWAEGRLSKAFTNTLSALARI